MGFPPTRSWGARVCLFRQAAVCYSSSSGEATSRARHLGTRVSPLCYVYTVTIE